jgi:acyl-CoA synthetase (AMP-forming)/AMP-acid ligase II
VVLDDDGYLTITDRVANIIIRGGENISAQEVEEAVPHHDGQHLRPVRAQGIEAGFSRGPRSTIRSNTPGSGEEVAA